MAAVALFSRASALSTMVASSRRHAARSRTARPSFGRALHNKQQLTNFSAPLMTVATSASTSLVPQNTSGLDSSSSKFTSRAKRVTDFAIKFSHLTRTYEVHTWHLVMGLFQVKEGLSASVLRDCGIDNMEDAFLEVLYCFKLADALEPKAFHGDISFTNKAVHVLEHAWWIARCLEHDQVDAEHILASLAFYEVFEELFPDLDLSEDRIWKALHSSWDARGLNTDAALLKKQAKKFEKLFREYPTTKYTYPALEKFERVGPFY